LGKKAEECVAIEDSRSGTLSAVRAGIRVIGYTGSYESDERPGMVKLLTENGAKVIMEHWNQFDADLKKIEEMA